MTKKAAQKKGQVPMRWYQRVCSVVATDGFSGLYRRGWPKLTGRFKARPTAPVLSPKDIHEQRVVEAQREYSRLAAEFQKRTTGIPQINNYSWYHTIDLGNGLVTPGLYDYRPVLPAFQFPADMTGMNVLDVGSATGFFAFEFEKRGAQVVSVELPSLTEWDILNVDKAKVLKGFLYAHQVDRVEDAYALHLTAPFDFCHKALKSRVRRIYSSIYDLTPDRLGCSKFDLIFVGDLLIHTFSPLKALDVLASVCRGTMVVTMDIRETLDARPVLHFVGHEAQSFGRAWWVPNQSCMEHLLHVVGFETVSMVGHFAGIIRNTWSPYDRAIFHATRASSQNN
jgi:tRNA (mo5U34)-methyltransferase